MPLTSHLILSFIFFGATASLGQILLVRELLVVFSGNELCLGVIFFSWFTGILLGAGVGSRAAARSTPGSKHDLLAFAILQLLLVLLLLVEVCIARTVRRFTNVPVGQMLSFWDVLVGGTAVVTPVGFLIGLAFPFACKLWPEGAESGAVGIGRVYIYESLGSLIGGLAFTFLFAQRVSAPRLVCCATVISLMIATLLLRRTRLKAGLITLVLLLAATILSPLPARLDSWTVSQRWRALNPDMTLVASRDSRYQHYSLGLLADQYNLFGNGQFMFSFPDPYDSANRAHFFLCEHPQPRVVLLVGGAASGMLKEVLKHPVERVDYLELDPVLIEIVEDHLAPEDKAALADPRVHVHNEDGRHFVQRTGQRYDVVVLNVPEPSTAMANRFFTREFFAQVKAILAPGGILVTGVKSAPNYLAGEVGAYAGSVYATLTKVFSDVLVTPGEMNYFFASTSPGSITADIETLSNRFDERNIVSDYFTRYNFEILMQPEQVKFVNEAFRSKTDLRVNTDLRPVTYLYNLVLWTRYAAQEKLGRLDLGSALLALEKRVRWLVWAPGAVLVAILGLLVLRGKGSSQKRLRLVCLLAIAVAGGAGMTFEMILLFAYQSAFGYLYHEFGLVVALFMFGLAAGSQAINRLMSRRELRWPRLLIGLQLCIAGLSLAMIPAVMWAEHGTIAAKPLLLVLVVGSGVLTGAGFPLASKIYSAQGASQGRTAGLIDAADHLGAALGAGITGVLALPVIGLTGTCVVVALCCAFVAALVFLKMNSARG